ncbi:Isoleucine--tRNA ligase [uncultured archaeon]|nr:Isoleucine--tRNA ligase [uncultured archaeon]
MLDFNTAEKEILEFWDKNKIYEKVKKKNSKGKKFYFLQGPPYTSGRLHIGHAWNNTLKDLVLRYKRMQGFNVWDRAGYDMHGLPTENAVQKKLGIKDKLEIEKYGVEKFVKECKKFSSENAKIMDKDLERLGVWMDFENAYWPIKNEFIEGEWWLIKKAFEQKRLYKGKKIMQWCGECETSLAKHELEYETVKENSIFLKFQVKNKKNEYIVIWTTTPWTIPFNLAVMVNPSLDYVKAEVETKSGKEIWIVAKALVNVFVSGLLDLKFRIIEEFKGDKLEGLEYEHPFYGKLKNKYDELKKQWKKVHTIILSEEYVDTSAGSGLVHCAPGCGPEDYEVGKKYGIGAFNDIDEKGTFSESYGEFNGLRAKVDDKKFIEALDKSRALIIQTPVEHEYAHCWRCHKPVVFRATEQWFMKIEDLIPKILDFNKKVKWQPDFATKNYDLWIENLKDNGITRQRYWGCPAPIWICECGETEVIGSAEELKKRAGKIPEDLHKPWIDAVTFKCKKCKKEMKRVPDVIDVWIDSGTTSWNCLYYPANKKNIDYWPADFILEATEQIRLWFSMLQMCSAIAFGKSCYKSVYCHGMILDYQGVKMSKSLGNIISPYEVVDKYGADILRYYMCETPAGENINFNWETVKIKQGNLNILYNIANFLKELNSQTKEDKKIDVEEKYILSRKNQTIKRVNELMGEYKIDEIIQEIENLFLDLSRVYIKSTREKVNSDKAGKVLFAVKDVYLDVLKMFSIICPFVTEKIWQDLVEKNIVKEESVHLCSWPKEDKKLINEKLEKEFKTALEIIEKGLYARDKAQIGLKWPLANAKIKCLNKISKELIELVKSQLNIKNIELDASEKNKETIVELDTKMTPELESEGYAREISRKVQAARKNAGFVKTDFIKLAIIIDESIVKLIGSQKEFIKERVNAKEILLDKIKESDYKNKAEDKIKGKEIKILFNKI